MLIFLGCDCFEGGRGGRVGCVCVCVCVCGGGGGGGRVTYLSLVPSDVIPADLTNTGRDQRDQSRNHHDAVPPTDQVSGLPTPYLCVCVCARGGRGGVVLVPSDVIPTDLTNTGRDQRDQSRNHHEHRAATGGAVPPTDQVSGLPTENAMFVCVCVCVCGLF